MRVVIALIAAEQVFLCSAPIFVRVPATNRIWLSVLPGNTLLSAGNIMSQLAKNVYGIRLCTKVRNGPIFRRPGAARAQRGPKNSGPADPGPARHRPAHFDLCSELAIYPKELA